MAHASPEQVFLCGLLALAVAIVAFAVFEARRQRRNAARLDAAGIRTTATVVLEWDDDGSGRSVTVRFSAGAAYGSLVRSVPVPPALAGTLRRGEPIEVEYDPEDPRNFRIARPRGASVSRP